MFSKGTTLLAKDLVSSSALRITQRRGSTELQRGISLRRNSICGPCDTPAPSTTNSNNYNKVINFNGQYHTSSTQSVIHDNEIPTILENGQALIDDSSLDSITKRRSSFSDRLVNPGRRYSVELGINHLNNFVEVSKVKDILHLDTGLRNSFLPNKIISEKSVVQLDAERTFEAVWSQFSTKYGVENLDFPKEVTFLLGGPGAGKGTNTKIIQESLGVSSDPIVVSSLLNSPECEAIKKQGGLVNDKLVLELLLNKLGKPDYLVSGNKPKSVIIDGFPRNEKQVKFVELLYEKLANLRTRVNPNATLPKFRITVLHVSEAESVSRQLSRGAQTIEENTMRRLKQLPELEVRDTDIDPNACKKRYDIYMSQYSTMKSLSKRFQYDEIDANGSLSEVEDYIKSIYST